VEGRTVWRGGLSKTGTSSLCSAVSNLGRSWAERDNLGDVQSVPGNIVHEQNTEKTILNPLSFWASPLIDWRVSRLECH